MREPFRLVNRVPIRECGEPLVALSEHNADLLLSEGCVPFVRQGVSAMLRIATASLPTGYKLRVGTALRTLKMQSDMYWHHYNKMKVEHPAWPEATVRRMCNRFFAPPDTKAPPGHCTGGAVDVNLCNESGENLDCSAPLQGWNAAPTAARGLSESASLNRNILAAAMHEAGFSNCRDEWWHWSYGDSAWAVRVAAPVAIYGFIDAPAEWLNSPERSKPDA